MNKNIIELAAMEMKKHLGRIPGGFASLTMVVMRCNDRCETEFTACRSGAPSTRATTLESAIDSLVGKDAPMTFRAKAAELDDKAAELRRDADALEAAQAALHTTTETEAA